MVEIYRYFGVLGEHINQAWGVERSLERFTAIAVGALAAYPPLKHLRYEDLLSDVLERRIGPQRIRSTKFGQPAVTVFLSEDFAIDIYFWREATPGIHNHPFYGVFTILRGFSVHFTYRFVLESRLDEHVLFGAVVPEDVELLKEGDYRAFGGGPTHRLIHVPPGSISMVIRTTNRPVNYYSYLEPCLGIEIDREWDDRFERKMQLLDTIAATEEEMTQKYYVRQFLQGADLRETYRFLERHCRRNRNNDVNRFALESARGIHGQTFDKLEMTLEKQLSIWIIEGIRRRVCEEDRLLATLASFIESSDELIRRAADLTGTQSPLDALVDMFARGFEVNEPTASDVNELPFIRSIVRSLLGATTAPVCQYDAQLQDHNRDALERRIRQFPLLSKYLN